MIQFAFFIKLMLSHCIEGCRIKLKIKYHQNSIVKLQKETNFIPLTYINMTVPSVTWYKHFSKKVVLWSQISPLCEIMQSYKWFPHLSKIPTFTQNNLNMKKRILAVAFLPQVCIEMCGCIHCVNFLKFSPVISHDFI